MVPFLVLLPLVENSDMTSTGAMDLLSQLGPTALQTVGSLGLLLLTGRIVLRRVFKVPRPPGSPPQAPAPQPAPPLASMHRSPHDIRLHPRVRTPSH